MQSHMICLPCRIQLVAAAVRRARAPRPRAPQWQARPSTQSASSTTTTPTPDPNSNLDLPSKHGFVHSSDPDVDIDLDIDIDIDIAEPWRTEENAPVTPLIKRTDASRWSVLLRKRNSYRKEPSKNASLKLFERVVKEQGEEEKRAQPDGQRDLSPETVEWHANLAELRPMLQTEPLDKCLDFFQTKLWDPSPPERRKRLLKQRGAYLMNKVADAKMEDFDNEKLPSIAQITQLFHDMDSLVPARWTSMVMGLITAIIGKPALRRDYPSDESHEVAMARKAHLLDDLVDSWIVFHRCKLSADDSKLQTSAEAEFRFPEIDTAQLTEFASKPDFKGALSCIFPNWVIQTPDIAAVVIATFVLLVDPVHSSASARTKANPLLAPIGRIISACPLRQPVLVEMMSRYSTVLLYVKEQMEVLIRRLHGQLKGDDQEHKERREKKIQEAQIFLSSTALGRKASQGIRRALSMGDVLKVESAWTAFWGDDRYEARRKQLRDQPRVFDSFIMAFTALKRPNRAIDVWDAMTRVVGIPPTLLTWTAMIEGCRKAKNAIGIENVWRKLVAWAQGQNLALDHIVWSARITGLIESYEPQAGLRALNEMARLSKISDGTKVNINVVNAAVSGLMRTNATSAANKVLSWAAKQYDGEDKIEPDVVTYNMLLGPMVTNGQVAQIKATLQMMADNDVKPDAATYTILLEGLINEDLDPTNQVASVQSLMREMKTQGIDVPRATLARMLHLVLCNGKHTQSHTEGAAGIIVEHMRGKDRGLSPQVYTVLVDSYFSRTPPALREIDALLREQLKCDADALYDRIFWERVIKGFALAGETERAFAKFEEIQNTGAAITLDTLEILVRSLVADGKNTWARRVVDTIKASRGASVSGFNNSVEVGRGRDPRWYRYWQHGFWAYALECGFLGAEEWRDLRRAAPAPAGAVFEPAAGASSAPASSVPAIPGPAQVAKQT